MIGQEKLLEKINLYNVDTFPRSCLIVGEKGSGKHTLVSYINENIVKFPLYDITATVSAEYIDEIYRNPNPGIYLINLSEMTEKQQNVLLKFVEEPLNNSFIILLSESKNLVLNTIINRCICFEMEAYSKAELGTFLTVEEDKDLILNILRTPGKILSTNINNMKALYELCDKMITKTKYANYANTLTIADKINFKDDYDKFDLDIFFDCLCFTMFNNYLNTGDINTLKLYELTRDQRKILIDKRVNKELFFENFLTKFWKLAKELN